MLKQHDKDNKNLTKEVEDELAYLERHGRHMENQPQRRANRQKLIERIERERKHLVDLSPFVSILLQYVPSRSLTLTKYLGLSFNSGLLILLAQKCIQTHRTVGSRSNFRMGRRFPCHV